MTRSEIARGPALVVGGGILTMAVLAGLVGLLGPSGLLTGTDLAATFRDSLTSPEALRWSVAALVVVAVLDLVVAWGVYQLFSPAAPALARLAAWSRLGYAVLFLTAISQLVGTPDRRGLADFVDIWQVSLVLFAVHLATLGVLGLVSGQIPKLVSVLLVVAGLGYLVDSFGYLLVTDYSVAVGTFTFIGELLLGLWLVARAGRRTTRGNGRSTPAQVTQPPRTPSPV